MNINRLNTLKEQKQKELLAKEKVKNKCKARKEKKLF